MARKAKSVPKKAAPKKKAAAKKSTPRSTKWKSALKKVMTSSIPYVESLIPIISKAALNSGYLGTIGTGMAVAGLMSQTPVAKEAIRLLISKTSEILEKGNLKKHLTDAMIEAAGFDDLALSLSIVKPTRAGALHRLHPEFGMKTVLSGSKRRTDNFGPNSSGEYHKRNRTG